MRRYPRLAHARKIDRHGSRATIVRGFAVVFEYALHNHCPSEIFPMRSRNSESFIVLPLLPIFLLGAFPMLLLSLMGPAGLVILGILIASVGLTDVLESNSAYTEQIIVHGYTRGTERAIQRTNLRSEIRFAVTMIVAGAGLAAAGLYGIFCYG